MTPTAAGSPWVRPTLLQLDQVLREYVLPRHFWLQGWQPYKVNSQGRLPVKLFPYQYEDTMAQHVLGLPQQCVNIHSPFFGGNLVLFLPRQTNVLFGLQESFPVLVLPY